MKIDEFFQKYDGICSVFNPSPTYDGEFSFDISNLIINSLSNNNDNLFLQFLNKKYYSYLNEYFESISKKILTFPVKLISCPNSERYNGRILKFDKLVFYKGLLSFFNQNIDILNKSEDEQKKYLDSIYNKVISSNDDNIKLMFTNIIREKLKKLNELYKNELSSEYYDYAFKDYEKENNGESSFRVYLSNLIKMYNDMLTGLIKLSDFFDREIDYQAMSKCFSSEVFYQLFAKIILEENKNKFNYSYEYLLIFKNYLDISDSNITIKWQIDNKIIDYTSNDFLNEFNELFSKNPGLLKKRLPEVNSDFAKYQDIDIMNMVREVISDAFFNNWEFISNGDINLKIELLNKTDYLFKPLKGINKFNVFYAYMYDTGKVVIEKYVEDEEYTPTYILSLEDFEILNENENIDILKELEIKRIFHEPNKDNWFRKVNNAIYQENNYKIKDVIRYVERITNELNRDNEAEDE